MKSNKYKKIIHALSFVISLVLLSACEKDANVKLPSVDKKLVMVSFISPQDSLIKVQVSLSQPLYNTSTTNAHRPVEDANVTISSIYGSQTLHYNVDYKCYLIDSLQLKVRAGVTYVLAVSTPDGKKAISSTTIPEQNTSLNIQLTQTEDWLDNYSVKASWQDPGSKDNYYRLFLENMTYYIQYSSNPSGVYEDTVYTRGVQEELTDDLRNPGGILNNTYSFSFNVYPEQENHFSLLHVSKEYYTYHSRLYAAANSGNPFAEPVQMPTNVEGGFGVFAGYNMYRVKLDP